jgi:NADPH2:quinone reductase
VAVGEPVTGARPGARVTGVAFAEYMVLPEAAAMGVPAGSSAEQALGMAVNWPTALAALRPLAASPRARPSRSTPRRARPVRPR